MLKYALKRILWIIPTVLVVSLLIFGLMDLAPGDVTDTMISDEMTEEDIAELRAQFDLDKPMLYRYGKYMLNLLHGDMGKSDVSGISVWDFYTTRFPMTLKLSALSLLVGVIIAIPLGIVAAKHSGTIVDNATTSVALLGISMPTFWIGLLLLYCFSHYLKIFPAAYDGTLKSYVLPVITSGFMLAANTTRQTRSAMLEVLRQDYLRTARSKGVSERDITFKHALPNALIPIITQVGMQLARTLAGSVVVETVFSWPGIGQLTVEAINRRDVTLATGGVIFTLVIFVLVVLIVDLLYAAVDPRIRAQFSSGKKKVKKGGAAA